MKTVTQNACQLCAPLGASLVFKGIDKCIPLLHGSQGCATYIRRYMISHFREPIDIASSSFTEETAIFGGASNLRKGLENVIRQYEPEIIGIASTCLSETIGDDVPMILREWSRDCEKEDLDLPMVVNVSTPSYSGSHSTGFHATVLALIKALAGQYRASVSEAVDHPDVNIFPGMVSAQDLRNIKKWASLYGLKPCLLPDYSESLDGPAWQEYQKIPSGGCRPSDIRNSSRARFSLELSGTLSDRESAALQLEKEFDVPGVRLPQPIGVQLCDCFFGHINEITGQELPSELAAARGRLIDSYADAHKYIYGRRAVIFGEKDHVLALAVFLEEIGITPVLCATGEGSGLEDGLIRYLEQPGSAEVLAYSDFDEIEKRAREMNCDLAIGNSKGYKLSESLGIPLVRTGFPIHDRIGAQRLPRLGYEGTQVLFDEIVNIVMEEKQNKSPVGYTYI